ncbi:MAG: hypothetical protein HYT36_00545 [Candidatus Staskawiczbacteria bacterium]|nr:hypothetical protein [Candidatus Staskawiczbacteria bacterium]
MNKTQALLILRDEAERLEDDKFFNPDFFYDVMAMALIVLGFRKARISSYVAGHHTTLDGKSFNFCQTEKEINNLSLLCDAAGRIGLAVLNIGTTAIFGESEIILETVLDKLNITRKTRKEHEYFGLILGYPECCVTRFSTSEKCNLLPLEAVVFAPGKATSLFMDEVTGLMRCRKNCIKADEGNLVQYGALSHSLPEIVEKSFKEFKESAKYNAESQRRIKKGRCGKCGNKFTKNNPNWFGLCPSCWSSCGD